MSSPHLQHPSECQYFGMRIGTRDAGCTSIALTNSEDLELLPAHQILCSFYSCHHRRSWITDTVTILTFLPMTLCCEGLKNSMPPMPATPVALWLVDEKTVLPQPRRLSPAARCASGTQDLVTTQTATHGDSRWSKSSRYTSQACADAPHNVRCSSFFTIFTVLDVGMASEISET